MIRQALFVFVVLLFLVAGVILHYINSKPTSSLKQIVTLTSYATPSLGVGFENHQALHGAKQNSTYPEMSSSSPMEFVYVQ